MISKYKKSVLPIRRQFQSKTVRDALGLYVTSHLTGEKKPTLHLNQTFENAAEHEKLKKFAQTRILESALAGPMFASMVKGLAVVEPDSTLDFFIPYLCSRIEDILLDQSLYSKVNNHFLN